MTGAEEMKSRGKLLKENRGFDEMLTFLGHTGLASKATTERIDAKVIMTGRARIAGNVFEETVLQVTTTSADGISSTIEISNIEERLA